MQKLTIEAGRSERHYWGDLWKYRELFYFLAWRDLLVRYKQTTVGVAWAVVRPALSVAILSIVFGTFAKMPSAGVPYPILVFCGMLPWQFFSTALGESGNSLVTNSNLISKIYFPRLVVPASSVIVSLVDFVISAVLLAGMLLWYQFTPSAHIVFLPLFVLLVFGASFGFGLWIAALMVKFRDFRFIIPFALQLGSYVTPVAYLYKQAVPEKYWLLYSANPIVGIVDGFRWCVLGGQHELYMPALAMSVGWVILLVVTGVWYFRRTEKTFADVI
jgi:lipopolysaccharide transport system permease protein